MQPSAPKPGATQSAASRPFSRPLLAACGVGLAAAGLWLHSRPKPQPLRLLVAVDTTTSVRPDDRKNGFKVLNAAIDRVLPPSTPLMVWRYDVNARQVASPNPQDGRAMLPLERELISAESKTTGTYPSNVLAQMATEAERPEHHGQGVALMLITDGEDTDQATTRKMVKRLGVIPNLKAVWIVGAAAESPFRSLIQKDYAPLGDRLIVSGAYDASAGLDRFREELSRK